MLYCLPATTRCVSALFSQLPRSACKLRGHDKSANLSQRFLAGHKCALIWNSTTECQNINLMSKEDCVASIEDQACTYYNTTVFGFEMLPCEGGVLLVNTAMYPWNFMYIIKSYAWYWSAKFSPEQSRIHQGSGSQHEYMNKWWMHSWAKHQPCSFKCQLLLKSWHASNWKVQFDWWHSCHPLNSAGSCLCKCYTQKTDVRKFR